IDLFIVRSVEDSENTQWRQQVEDLQANIWLWTGNRASPVDVTLAELAGMAKEGQAILSDLARDGIVVHGTPIETLLARRPGVRRGSQASSS
ncbi:hypothetical protein B1B_07311, partial [mine drainage metagenome]